MNIEDLKLKKWYKAHNIIFMPVEYSDNTRVSNAFGRYPERMVELAYLQPHWNDKFLDLSLLWWEVNITEDRQFLYHNDSENVLENRDIKIPSVGDFRSVIKTFFESEKWHTGASTSYLKPRGAEGLEIMRDIIGKIKT